MTSLSATRMLHFYEHFISVFIKSFKPIVDVSPKQKKELTQLKFIKNILVTLKIVKILSSAYGVVQASNKSVNVFHVIAIYDQILFNDMNYSHVCSNNFHCETKSLFSDIKKTTSNNEIKYEFQGVELWEKVLRSTSASPQKYEYIYMKMKKNLIKMVSETTMASGRVKKALIKIKIELCDQSLKPGKLVLSDLPLLGKLFKDGDFVDFEELGIFEEKERIIDGKKIKFFIDLPKVDHAHGAIFADQFCEFSLECYKSENKKLIKLVEGLYALGFSEAFTEEIGSSFVKILPKYRGRLLDKNLNKHLKLCINSPEFYSEEAVKMVSKIDSFPKTSTSRNKNKPAKAFETLRKNTQWKGLF